MESKDDDILDIMLRRKVANPDPPLPPYRRPSFEERLINIGIKDNFEFYMQYFNCQYIPEYWIKKYGVYDWYQPKRCDRIIPLTMYQVLAHLEQKFWISRALPVYTYLFAIDLDNHQRNHKELVIRYNKIIDVLPNPFVFQSSRRKGLHLYWFFKSPHITEIISQRLRKLLEFNDLSIEKGKLETFPGTCHNLRLPLGLDSFLLDNKILKSLNLSLHDSIEFIHSCIGNGDILFSSETDKLSRPNHIYPRSDNDSCRRINSFAYMESSAAIIVAEPISEYGTRNKRQMELIRSYASKGYPEDKVFNLIMEWYRSYPHKSKDLEQNPLRVEKELRSAVHNWFSKMHCRGFVIKGTLTLDDVAFIIKKTMQERPLINIGCEIYRLHKFIFNLLLFYKSKQTNMLNLAFNTIMEIPGASSRTAAKFMQYCMDIGLLTKTSEHDRFLHKSTGYKLNYNFQNGDGLKSFEEGLLKLYTRSDLYKMYKRSTYEQIIKHESHAVL